MTVTTGKKIIKNSLFIITGNFLNKAISIAVLIYLTSYLSPAGFGRFSFVISYTTFFGIFTDLGLNTFLTREICAGSISPSRGFGHAIILRLAATILTSVLLIVSLFVMGYPVDVIWLAAASCISLLLSFRGVFFRTVFNIPFQVHLKMNYPAVINFLNEILTLGIVIGLIAAGSSLFVIILGMALVNLPGFLALAFYSTRLVRPEFAFEPAVWKKLLKETIPLGGAVFLEGVFIIIPVFFLSLFASDDAMGYYGLSFRLVSSLWIVPVAVMMSLLPRMSLDAAGSASSVSGGFSKGLKLMLLIGLPMAAFTVYFSTPIISVLAGVGYSPAAPLLSIMIWGTFMYFINSVFFFTFTAGGRQGLNTLAWAFVSISSVFTCLALIPSFGPTGAAVGFVAPLTLGVLVNIFLARRVFSIDPAPIFSRFFLSGLSALIIMALTPFSPIVSLALAMCAYIITLLYQGTLSFREWEEWLGAGKVESK